jgi:beta-mannanase
MTAKKKRSSSRTRVYSKKRRRNQSRLIKFERRIFGLKIWHLGGLSLAIIGLLFFGLVVSSQPPRKSSADTGCSVSATLVNSCRPWLGATALNYPGGDGDSTGTNAEDQLLYHESRIGRQVDVVHTYHSQGHNTLTSTDSYFATRANTMLFANWKPGNSGDSWATVASGADDNEITSMANSIKALGSTKIFLTIWHEPENDVSPGGDPKCPSVNYKGTEGSVADYTNMWHHVRTVFNADGVTNVVWAVDFMNYSAWDCLIPDLYPGDSYVDWVVFNAYQQSNGATFETTVKRFTNLLTSDNIASSKPLGIVEWGSTKYAGQTTAQSLASEETYYDSAKAALDGNDSTMSRIKLYMVFDENDQGATGCTATNDRVGYDDDCNYSSAKQSHYTAFADDPRFTNAFYATPTTTPSSPGNGTTNGSGTGSSEGSSTTTTTSGSTPSASPPVNGSATTDNSGGTTDPAANAVSDGSVSNVDTSKLTNGTHVVTVIKNGKAIQQKIVVHNALPTAVANEISVHRTAYATGSGTFILLIAGGIWFFRRKISFWLLRHVKVRYLKMFGLSEIIKLAIRR